MKRVSDFSNCTGCAACVDICPQHAIKMLLNQEGFLYPKIDEKRCNLCGLCFTRCPSANPTYVNEQTPCCIAAMAPQRANSSSGGAFTVLAEETLRQGGYVCGAAWTDNLEVKHIIISKKEDLYKLQKSKYIQSTVSDIYPQIKKLLAQNKKVFFTGTPCQVAGLNAYLNNKYDNLLTADLICHGVPSPKVFKQYLHELPLRSNENIQSFDFRDKKEGWSREKAHRPFRRHDRKVKHDQRIFRALPGNSGGHCGHQGGQGDGHGFCLLRRVPLQSAHGDGAGCSGGLALPAAFRTVPRQGPD